MLRFKAVVVGLLGASVFAASAQAADPAWSVLRGSAYQGEPAAAPPRFVPEWPVYRRWEGAYVGGSLGLANAGMDFRNSTSALVANILRFTVVGTHVDGWTTLGKLDTSKGIYGGFVGYNAQWDGNVIVSAEANYSHTLSGGLYGAATDSLTRTFGDDAQAPAQHHFFYTATVSGTASARVVDYATARARAGVIFDRFLPYAFVGAAVGRVDINRTATVSYVRQDFPDVAVPPAPPIPPLPNAFFGPQTEGLQRKGVFAYGYAAGLGLDFAVLTNVFLRAEWEYVQFVPVESFKIHLNSGRVGVAVKF